MFEKGFLEDEPILLDMVFRWVEITSLQHYLQEQRKGGSKTPNLAGPKILPFCNTLGHSVLSLYIYIYTHIYKYTWNPNDPCFDWKKPCFGGLTFKNRGHLGSRYIYMYIYIYMELSYVLFPHHLFLKTNLWLFATPFP